MDWFKKHGDTIWILGGLLSCFLWINSQFKEVNIRFTSIDKEMSMIEKDVAIIKTVLVLKNIYPHELAVTSEEK